VTLPTILWLTNALGVAPGQLLDGLESMDLGS
jgi:hypothetical protein